MRRRLFRAAVVLLVLVALSANSCGKTTRIVQVVPDTTSHKHKCPHDDD